MKASSVKLGFPVILQGFFSHWLIQQVSASPRTISSYRDTFRLLLGYASEKVKKPPASLTMEDLDAPLILSFLDHLEEDRANTARTRNARLASIRSFMHYASAQEPLTLGVVQRVLAIPQKRFARPLIGFLSRAEIDAVCEAPDRSTWSGRRDRVMWITFYNLGARVSEMTGLQVGDITLGSSASARIHGKGRKERVIPLWRNTAGQIKDWLRYIDPGSDAPLFPNRLGTPLTRSGVEYRLRVAVRKAAQTCPSLSKRRISPHHLRHTTAMHLLQAGVDLSVIALWLGHESSSTTHMYLEADLQMKERALGKTQEPASRRIRFKASDRLLRFLDGL